jgi:hypothetical protein
LSLPRAFGGGVVWPSPASLPDAHQVEVDRGHVGAAEVMDDVIDPQGVEVDNIEASNHGDVADVAVNRIDEWRAVALSRCRILRRVEPLNTIVSCRHPFDSVASIAGFHWNVSSPA